MMRGNYGQVSHWVWVSQYAVGRRPVGVFCRKLFHGSRFWHLAIIDWSALIVFRNFIFKINENKYRLGDWIVGRVYN
jgi:hypothetical protein